VERIRQVGGAVPDAPLGPSLNLSPRSSAEFELITALVEAVLPASGEEHEEGDEDDESDYARNDASNDWTGMRMGMGGEGRAQCWGRGAVWT